MKNRKRGFTLIELLVAISILAIVAVLGWRGLDTIVRTRLALNRDLEHTRGLQLAFAQMQSDCLQLVTSQIVGGRPRLAMQPGYVTLIRTVFSDNQPSRLQVIAYQLRDGVLTRRESVATRDLNELDAAWSAMLAGTDTAQKVVLQSDVEEMAVRSWDNKNKVWRASDEAPNPTPVGLEALTGLEVALRLRDRSTPLVKIFLLGAV